MHGSNSTFGFVSMKELEFHLLTWVLTQIFNTRELVKFLEKNQRFHIQIGVTYI
jgi:hypothetical protein